MREGEFRQVRINDVVQLVLLSKTMTKWPKSKSREKHFYIQRMNMQEVAFIFTGSSYIK